MYKICCLRIFDFAYLFFFFLLVVWLIAHYFLHEFFSQCKFVLKYLFFLSSTFTYARVSESVNGFQCFIYFTYFLFYFFFRFLNYLRMKRIFYAFRYNFTFELIHMNTGM